MVAEALGHRKPARGLLYMSIDQIDEVAALQAENAHMRRVSKLRRLFVDVTIKYFVNKERGLGVTVPYEDVVSDSNPDWIPSLLKRRDVHEPEFSIFRYFTNTSETILDIGANYGYSAASIWASGCKAHVLSFEPNPAHRACLAKIKSLKPRRYDFVGCGLGPDAGTIEFIIPVINGVAASSLASADLRHTIAWAAQETFVNHALTYCSEVEEPTLRFAVCEWAVHPLDDVLSRESFDVPIRAIPAIKIDVEGFEAAVLRSAPATLRKHRPLIMIEAANRDPEVSDILSSAGYVFADFDGLGCVLNAQKSTRINGFFLHATRLDEYRRMGMLRG